MRCCGQLISKKSNQSPFLLEWIGIAELPSPHFAKYGPCYPTPFQAFWLLVNGCCPA